MLILITYISQFVNLFQPLLIMPIALNRMDDVEVSIWLFMLVLLALARLIETSLGNALVRGYSFYNSGLEFNKSINLSLKVDYKNNEDKNDKEIISLFNATMKPYVIFSISSFLISVALSVFFVNNLATTGDHIINISGAIILFCISTSISIYDSKYMTLWRGTGLQKEQKMLELLIAVIKISITIILLLYNMGIYAIAIAYFTVSLISYILHKYRNQKIFNKCKGYINKDSLIPFHNSIKKYLVMAIGGFLIANITSIIVSELENPKLIAQYLISLRLMLILKQFSLIPTTLAIPTISNFYACGKHEDVKIKLFSLLRVQNLIYLFGASFLLLLGSHTITIFTSNTTLLAEKFLFYILLFGFLELQHVSNAIVYEQKNIVPIETVISSIISGVLILCLTWSFIVVLDYGFIILIFVPLVVQMLFNNWYPVYLNCRSLKITAREYATGALMLPKVNDFKFLFFGLR